MTDKEVTLLPEPDSPTMAKVRPFSDWKDTPFTGLTTPRSVVNAVTKFSTFRTVFGHGALLSPKRDHTIVRKVLRNNDKRLCFMVLNRI